MKALLAPAGDPGLFGITGAAAPLGRGPARVVATDSGVLFNALAEVFISPGFDGLGDEMFRGLVITRIVEPASVLDGGRVLQDLGQASASYATMKYTIGRGGTGKYRDRIAAWCFKASRHHWGRLPGAV